MKKDFIPAQDYIKLEMMPEELSRKIGSIYVPDSAKTYRFKVGKITAVSPQVKRFTVGEVVVLPLEAGVEMTMGEDKYTLAKADDVIGTLVDAPSAEEVQ